MKKYKCIKVVDAEPQYKDGEPGYKVIYKDGYTSWSPKKAFEEGYIPLKKYKRHKKFKKFIKYIKKNWLWCIYIGIQIVYCIVLLLILN